MDKIFNLEIDGQITLPNGSTLGPLEETTVNVVQPSEGGSDPILNNAKETGGIGWSVSSRGTLFTDLQGVVVDTSDDYYAELNTDVDIDFSEIEQKYEDGAKLFITVNGLTYSDVELYEDEGYNEIRFSFTDGVDYIGKIYQYKVTGKWFYSSLTTVVPVGNATFSMSWENDEVHPINPKYIDGDLVVTITVDEDNVFTADHSYDEIAAKFPNVKLYFMGQVYNPLYMDDGLISFSTMYAEGPNIDYLYYQQFNINNANDVIFTDTYKEF